MQNRQRPGILLSIDFICAKERKMQIFQGTRDPRPQIANNRVMYAYKKTVDKIQRQIRGNNNKNNSIIS